MGIGSHLDLCSGIGGFALAAGWAGYTTIGFCEIDPFCQRVLRKHWPEVPQHDDIWTLPAPLVGEWSGGERIDLITGGYPCQPFSLAGERRGEDDHRHLWPAIAALVAALRPRRCLFENVAGHISMGLDTVLADLEALGYETGAVVLPAASVGAPHRRDRIWIMADANGYPEQGSGIEHMPVSEKREAWVVAQGGVYRRGIPSPDQVLAGRYVAGGAAKAGSRDKRVAGVGPADDGVSRWMAGAGVSNPWIGDWEEGCSRVREKENDRVNKLKALGNAIVPQVAYQILTAWEEVD